jgi:hypothetical protein
VTSLEEALAALGLTADATQEQAKRAYLRKLKTTSPERDPEGFAALRATYEHVRAGLAFKAFVAEREREADTDTNRDGAGVPDPEIRPEPEPEPEPEPGLSPDPEPLRPSDGVIFRASLEATNASGWRDLADAYDRAADSADRDAVADAGVRMTLLLLDAGDAAALDAFSKSYYRWLGVVGSARAFADPGDVARWAIVRELRASWKYLAPEVRRPLAHALLDDDLPSAWPALERVRREHPYKLDSSVEALRRDAPTIFQTLPPTLLEPGLPRGARASSPGNVGWPLGLIAAGVLIGVLKGGCPSTERERSVPAGVAEALHEARAHTQPQPPPPPWEPHPAWVIELREATKDADTPESRLVELIENAVALKDCRILAISVRELESTEGARPLQVSHPGAWDLMRTAVGDCR